MKKKNYKNQLKVINASRGMEHRVFLIMVGFGQGLTCVWKQRKNMIEIDRIWNSENILSFSNTDFIAGKRMGKEQIYNER